ncbi:MAG: hypothetical protein FJ090_22855, partial [Deltaproteobacteria bacterium]|nr:hypothetical protein [Deltaproteobacteria bacterium]
ALLPGLAAFRETVQGAGDSGASWRLERAERGTVAVPLARGARLAVAEIGLGDAPALMRALTPLPDPVAVPTAELRDPLDWLGAEGEGVLAVLERGVVTGWLDADREAGPAAEALRSSTYDRLREMPAVKLLDARDRELSDPAAGAAARARLEEALIYALGEAAADRDREQAAMRTRRAELLAAYPGATDAAAALLADAERLATADAGADASLAVAMVAQSMQRWRGRCPDAPCGGFDRIGMIDTASRLDPGLRGHLATWWVVLWKESLDNLHASWDYANVTSAMDPITELAASRDPRAMDWTLLHRRQPDPVVGLAWCRALGLPEATSKEGVLLELGRYLQRIAANAIPVAPEAAREPLARVARRATE